MASLVRDHQILVHLVPLKVRKDLAKMVGNVSPSHFIEVS